MPGGTDPAFFLFPAPVMDGHIVQHLAEGKAPAVLLLPQVRRAVCSGQVGHYGS